ncbi:hypothetical protein [Micromonospora thermarum]|uniref:Secreted protein n=1 Tax=Micromonospora thermarum TaxID=2720024 RepID=A0ABX0ZDE1_9ACTN|nr:hypothetical protein [Micromonospora thermarum]NJP35503.1 hypothetical protein [Micromonospora thermarum]
MRDVVINLLATAIAAAAGWTSQYIVRYRRILRKRSFFGVSPGAQVMLFVAKHFSSQRPQSVHRNDVATLVELATTIRESGGLPALVTSEDGHREAGRVTEYCVGGPSANPRTAAHLRIALPGVRFTPAEPDSLLPFSVGDRAFRRRPGAEQFALLARVRPSASAAPVFILAGQTALDNLGAARYLMANWRGLRKTYGNRNFCLVLGLREPSTFGADHVHLVADVSVPAFTAIAGAPEPDHEHRDEPDTAVAALDPSHHD